MSDVKRSPDNGLPQGETQGQNSLLGEREWGWGEGWVRLYKYFHSQYFIPRTQKCAHYSLRWVKLNSHSSSSLEVQQEGERLLLLLPLVQEQQDQARQAEQLELRRGFEELKLQALQDDSVPQGEPMLYLYFMTTYINPRSLGSITIKNTQMRTFLRPVDIPISHLTSIKVSIKLEIQASLLFLCPVRPDRGSNVRVVSPVQQRRTSLSYVVANETLDYKTLFERERQEREVMMGSLSLGKCELQLICCFVFFWNSVQHLKN